MIQGRFAPGDLLGERYRIISLVGRGGMGEVYRADDLKLEQPVALKFLPESLALDATRLAHFREEVRIARQVSHRNVCRVYDIGDMDGQHFISMEFVDGEDLASLLRRIGRLPYDKGIEIARQLCAGLAAAHEKGFIHRDLKPANIMIDSRGLVRIMDFGLAALAEDELGNRAVAGTPAYMAPEQLAGQGASVRSDLYALGLVLYEIFTGKSVHTGHSVAEIRRQQQDSTPALPSSIVKHFDPAVERVILHCLETAPELRPPSAIAVAAALPGGDPLAAALAAGEMPSPEVVAAAGLRGALRPAVGWACLAGVLLMLALNILVSGQLILTGRVPFDKPPAVLAERAREVIQRLGYTDPPADRASGFASSNDYLRYVYEHDHSLTRWNALASLRPAAAYFWYREGPEHLIPLDNSGEITRQDPPPLVSGMKQVRLDTRGRLIYFDAVPPQADARVTAAAAAAPDWRGLFELADLDWARFTPADSMWNPPMFCDTVAAWNGSFAGSPQTAIRVEAGAYRGRPVYFRLLGPWSVPQNRASTAGRAGVRAALVLNVGLVLAALIGAILIVRRNLRQGLGDRRGAIRIALAIFGARMLAWLIRASHVPSPSDELELFVKGLGVAMFFAATLWLLYMALEPTVRRRWPTRILSWSRLLAGRYRDVLLGILCGAASILVLRLATLVPTWLGMPPLPPITSGLGAITGAGAVLSTLLQNLVTAVLNALFFLFFPLLILILVRRAWLAIGLFTALLVTMFVLASDDPLISLPAGLLLVGLWVFAALRFGLLASAASFFTFFTVTALPLTSDPSAWYLGTSLLGVGIVAALAAYGLHTSLGKSPG
jgi:hypothetical protein